MAEENYAKGIAAARRAMDRTFSAAEAEVQALRALFDECDERVERTLELLAER